jgi:hypothetical protein
VLSFYTSIREGGSIWGFFQRALFEQQVLKITSYVSSPLEVYDVPKERIVSSLDKPSVDAIRPPSFGEEASRICRLISVASAAYS